MKLIEAMEKAGEFGKIARPCWPIYPLGIEVDKDSEDELSITCDLSITDINADDYEVL